MERTSFDQLDRDLRQTGNNRRVIVRSDIVLHIPTEVRIARRMTRPYLWVFGQTCGTIVQAEQQFSPNPIYPWLDNKSFNKWFVPQGERLPISMLPPSRALRHDFRRKAFRKVLRFLQDLHLTATAAQCPLRRQADLWNQEDLPPTFVICGYSCAGKTSLASHLVDRHGYIHFEASDFMRVIYHERLGHSPDVELTEFAAAILKKEPHVVPEAIIEFLDRMQHAPCVITGFRAPSEVEFLLAHNTREAPIELVFVDAAVTNRFQRACIRDRGDAPDSLADMRRKDAVQRRMGLGNMLSKLPFHVLSNDASLEEYFQCFDERYEKRLRHLGAARLRERSPLLGALEQNILMFLANKDDSERYYSSAEIAHLIRQEGSAHIEVSKDNVSRYFNQRYSPFYEFAIAGHGRRFRLSQTGRAFAEFLTRYSPGVQHNRPHKGVEHPQRLLI
jgi:cytidylate kinase